MSVCDRAANRKGAFKKTMSTEDCRRKREEKIITVRKSKREEKLRKRRNMKASKSSSLTMSSDATDSSTQQATKPTALLDLSTLSKYVRSNDRETRFNAVQQIRRHLSKESNPPAKEIVDAGIVPILVKMIHHMDDPKLQFEAAWALTNITSTEYTKAVVEHNAIAPLVHLLRASKDPDVREQVVWCLGNIAGDGAKFRDLVLNTPNAVHNLMLNLAHPANLSMLRNATWTLSNMCRGKPRANIDIVKHFIPAVTKLIQNADVEVMSDSLWALSYISDGENNRIETVLKAGVVKDVVKALGHSNARIVIPALRTIGNIASGNDGQTQAIVDAGIVEMTGSLMMNVKRSIRKEACWLLSNIAAGNTCQISALMSNDGVLRQVIEAAKQDEWEVRKEAAWVIANVCTGGNSDVVAKIVNLGALEALVSLMEVSDTTIVCTVLDATHGILSKAEIGSQYDVLLDSLDGVEKIENLQNHSSNEIYNKAIKIIEDFFSGDEEDECENIAPKMNDKTFSFGTNFGSNAAFGDISNAQFSF